MFYEAISTSSNSKGQRQRMEAHENGPATPNLNLIVELDGMEVVTYLHRTRNALRNEQARTYLPLTSGALSGFGRCSPLPFSPHLSSYPESLGSMPCVMRLVSWTEVRRCLALQNFIRPCTPLPVRMGLKHSISENITIADQSTTGSVASRSH